MEARVWFPRKVQEGDEKGQKPLINYAKLQVSKHLAKCNKNILSLQFLKTVEDVCGGALVSVNLQEVCCFMFYTFIQYLSSSFN